MNGERSTVFEFFVGVVFRDILAVTASVSPISAVLVNVAYITFQRFALRCFNHFPGVDNHRLGIK